MQNNKVGSIISAFKSKDDPKTIGGENEYQR